MEPEVNFEKLDNVLKVHNYQRSAVIAILQEVQEEYHYLPMTALEYLSLIQIFLQRYAVNPGISGHYRFEKPE